MSTGDLLSDRERRIIAILAADGGWMYALDIVARSDGQLRHATIYAYLGNLEARAFVEFRDETPEERARSAPSAAGSHPRRLYRITDAGRRIPEPARGTTGLVPAPA